MIAFVVTSRGLIFSKTVESIFNGMKALAEVGIASKLILSHDLPIPDSQNYVTETALQDANVKRLLFIEEDMYLYPETVVALATSEADIATVQYNDKNGSPHGIIHYNGNDEILWAGLGATIAKREVFEKIGKPYFRIDTRYKITKKRLQENGKLVVDYVEQEPREIWDDKTNQFVKRFDDYKYGGQDINFYTRARKAGCRIIKIDNHKAAHFDLVKLGEPHMNNGCHVIKQV